METMDTIRDNYQSFFDNNPDGLFRSTPEGKYLVVNKAMAECWGYDSPAEMIEQIKDISSQSYLYPEDRLIYQSLMSEHGYVDGFEHQALKKDGSMFWCRVSSLLVKDSAGAVMYYEGSTRDITAQIQSQHKLRESEDRYEAISAYSHTGICIFDDHSKILWANAKLASMTQRSVDHLLAADSFAEFIAPESMEIVMQQFYGCISGQTYLHSYEFYLLTASGDKRLVEIYVTDYRNYQGQLNMICSLKDITDKRHAEAALAASEEQYRRLADNMQDFVLEVDAEGIIQYASPSYKNLGHSPGDLVGTSCFDMVYPEDLQKVQDIFFTSISDPGAAKAVPPYRFLTKDGGLRWAVAYGVYLYDNEQRLTGGLLVSRDITAQKMVEDALRDSESKYASLVKSAHNAIFVMEGNIFVECNDRALDLYSCSREEIVGHSPLDLSPAFQLSGESSLKAGAKIIAEAYEGKSQSFEWVHLRRDGVPFDAEITLNRFDTSKGPYLLSVVRDITAQKLVAADLEAQRAFNATLIDTIASPMFFKDTEGRYLGCNKAFETYHGVTREWLIGKTVFDLFAMEEESARMHDLMDKAMLSGSGARTYDGAGLDSGGQIRPIIVHKAPYPDANGKVAGLVGVFTDITDLKRAEKELELHRQHLEEVVKNRTAVLSNEVIGHQLAEEALLLAKETAEAANKAKSAFLANMSHELRTPLQAILGFTDVLEKQFYGPLNERQSKHMQNIASSGQHLLALVNDVLDLSKIEAGKMDLSYESISVQEFIMDAVSVIEEKARAQNIKIHMEIGAEIVGQTIMADPRLLRQVLFNLLSNAAKFTPPGGHIIVGANMSPFCSRKHLNSERVIEVFVNDTGRGLSEEDQEKVFEEFYQVYVSNMGKNPGTGLGLPLARKIVEIHGGRIWAESSGVGRGSSFVFSLPCVPAHTPR